MNVSRRVSNTAEQRHDALVGEEEDGRHALVALYDLVGRSQYLVRLQLIELDETRNGHHPHTALLVHGSAAPGL